jgi:hypothetical protein
MFRMFGMLIIAIECLFAKTFDFEIFWDIVIDLGHFHLLEVIEIILGVDYRLELDPVGVDAFCDEVKGLLAHPADIEIDPEEATSHFQGVVHEEGFVISFSHLEEDELYRLVEVG